MIEMVATQIPLPAHLFIYLFIWKSFDIVLGRVYTLIERQNCYILHACPVNFREPIQPQRSHLEPNSTPR
jgi:hypothetical protein